MNLLQSFKILQNLAADLGPVLALFTWVLVIGPTELCVAWILPRLMVSWDYSQTSYQWQGVVGYR